MKIKKVIAYNSARPSIVRAEWSDGKVTEYDIDKLSDAVKLQLTHHGLKQKLMDAHSGTYKETASVAECRRVTDDVWEQLLAGDFNSERSGTPWIIEAFVDLFDIEESVAIETWAGLDDKSKKAAYKNPQVIEWKAARDLERAKASDAPTMDLAKLFAKK